MACGDAFLFSVTSPHAGGSVVRFPLKPEQERKAVYCDSGLGPTFGGGWDLTVHNSGGKPECVFNGSSDCGLGQSHASCQDVLSQGDATFTGARCFTPVEVEVYAVV